MRIGVVATLAACSYQHGRVTSDSGVVDMPPDVTMLRPWSNPVEIAELNSGVGDDDPSLTSDLLEIYWGSKRANGLGLEDIWMASRASPSDPWSMIRNVTELNSSSTETTIKVSADGLAIFFTSTRMANNYDIWWSRRDNRNATWDPPMRIAELSTNDGDYCPFARVDLRRVVLCRGSSVPNEAIYEAERATTTELWPTPTSIAGLDEAGISECDPMEPTATTMYLASNRSGQYDIYVTHRPYGALTEVPVNVTTNDDRDPWVSADERYLVFASSRSGVDRLYLSTR